MNDNAYNNGEKIYGQPFNELLNAENFVEQYENLFKLLIEFNYQNDKNRILMNKMKFFTIILSLIINKMY